MMVADFFAFKLKFFIYIHRMDEIYLRIPGKPLPKKTHRSRVFVKPTGGKFEIKRHSYFPQAEEAKKVQDTIKQQYTGHPLDTGLFVRFIFHMPVPPSWSIKQTKMALDGRLLHIGKPDASNLAKFYEDCMNGIVYSDDARIVWVNPIKKYDDEAYTEIYIRKFEWELFAEFQRMVA